MKVIILVRLIEAELKKVCEDLTNLRFVKLQTYYKNINDNEVIFKH